MLFRSCFPKSMSMISSSSCSARIQWRCFSLSVYNSALRSASMPCRTLYASRLNLALPFCSIDHSQSESSKQGPLKPGLYLVGTPIGNLEDITLRRYEAFWEVASALLYLYTTHFQLSYHKFNETQREQQVLKRLKDGEIVALISDAGTPGISDPGTELAKLCVSKGVPVIPIPGPSAFLTALSASGLSTNEFTFVGFLPKHASSRKERLMISANAAATQIFFIPPHKLSQFLEEIYCLFGASRQCVMAREMTKVHEEFWRGTVEEAKKAFSTNQPKGEITFIIEGKMTCAEETPTESQLENDLREMISQGNTLSEAVKLVAAGTSVRRKKIYSIALRKFGKQFESEDN